jgi:hypothetical protein
MPELSERQRTMIAAYQEAFGTDSGQAVLKDLERSYGRRQSHQSSSAFETAFREGERAVYLRILWLLDINLAETTLAPGEERDGWAYFMPPEEEQDGGDSRPSR